VNLYSYDGTYPTPLAAMIMGQTIAAAGQAAGIPPMDNLTASNADPSNLLSNGMFMTGSGGVGTGWISRYAGGTVTPTLVARSDNVAGNWQQIVIAEGPLSGYDIYQMVDLTAGDTYTAECELQTGNDWVGCTNFGITSRTTRTATSPVLARTEQIEAVPEPPPLLAGVNGVLRTPPFTTAHSGNNPLFLRFYATSGTVR
jgi:hypothetical protein